MLCWRTLPPAQLAKLDALLIPDPAFAATPLAWLRNTPTAPKPDHMAGTARSARVREIGVPPEAAGRIHCRMPTFGQRSAESPGQRLPALVWKIHLLHGAQTRLVQNAAITGDAPRTLSRLGTERIQGQCAALLKITQEIPVSLQARHGGQRGKPGRSGPGILLRL